MTGTKAQFTAIVTDDAPDLLCLWGYQDMPIYAILDAAQEDDAVAFVPETQVESLLAHLNG